MNIGTIMGYTATILALLVYLFPQPDGIFTGHLAMMWCTTAICFSIGGIGK